jgi:hypothetical protein
MENLENSLRAIWLHAALEQGIRTCPGDHHFCRLARHLMGGPILFLAASGTIEDGFAFRTHFHSSKFLFGLATAALPYPEIYRLRLPKENCQEND